MFIDNKRECLYTAYYITVVMSYRINFTLVITKTSL